MKQKKINWTYWVKLFVVALVLCWGLGNSMQVQAATEAQKEAFKEELLDIFMKQDTTTRDVSKYNLTRSEFYEVYKDFQKEEGLLIYAAYPYSPEYSITGSLFYLKTFTLKCTDTNVKSRYEKLCVAVDEIRAGIEPEMTDLDKILYLHDCVVERTTYGGSGDQIYTAGGALGDGRAVCMGYAYALNLLLNLEGFEQSYARSSSLQHGWTYVKLDDEWYHIDPTWDDTRSPKSGQTSRVHFMKNDEEFKTNHGSDLYAVDTSEASTSTKYSSWFLRSIVGKMCFEDGLWYYYDSSEDMVMRVNLDGSVCEAVVDCSVWGGESLVDVTGDVITVMANGFTQSVVMGDEIYVPDAGSSTAALPTLKEVNLCDFGNWISGSYHYQTGAYITDTSRLAVSSFVTCDAATEYKVTTSDSEYQVLIRELNSKQAVVASHNLKSGTSFTTSASTQYLAISIYAPNVSGLTYDEYRELFAEGFTVDISDGAAGEDVTEPDVDVEDDESVEEDTIVSDQVTSESGNINSEALEVDLNDFGNWRSGVYHYYTGIYTADSARICLKDYVTGKASTEYSVSISNGKYSILVRELNADMTVVASHSLVDGATFTTNANTEYLAISMYAPYISGMTYEKYATLFANGMTVSITAEEVIMDTDEGKNESTFAENTVEAWDFGDFANWRSGMYHYSTGEYSAYNTRICLVDYLEFCSASYYANISDVKYKMIIRELDENYNLMRTVILAKGASYTPGNDAKYLGISLYNVTGESGMSYEKFRQMFAEGFYAELVAQ